MQPRRNSNRIKAIVFLASIFFGLHFTLIPKENKAEKTLRTFLSEFTLATAQLRQKAEDFKFDRVSEAELRKKLDQVRHSYKKVEFILDYFFPSFIEEHINGAPLLHIEQHSTRPFVNPPEGLQVLDELIYSANAKSEKLQIAILAQKLSEQSKLVAEGFYQKRTGHHHLIEAARMQLVRIFTLGLTGFDTPGSVHAISEAQQALRALQSVLQAMPEVNNKSTLQRFDAAIKYLDNQGFEELDRLHFLIHHLQPLYAELLAFQPPTRSSTRVTGWNTNSQYLFSDQFLNPYFYAEISPEEDNPALRQLGKKLFYDSRISENGKLSCASCHKPQLAFSDGKTKSASNTAGRTVQRNSPTLINAVYADRYFYDLRAFSLQQQAEHVIFNHDEFNTAYDEIAVKLSSDPAYRSLFKEAFGSSKINRAGLSRAFASYIISLRSFNSAFDKYTRGEKETLAPRIKEGFNLFMGKAACGTCHFAPVFSGLVPPFYTKNESEILGVLQSPQDLLKKPDNDMGRYANSIYSEQAWIYERSFKTTSLRNVALTAPYFHNGAYETLKEVVDFYDHGGGAGLGLYIKNQTLPADSLHLTTQEKEALIAFMLSLTDTTGLIY